jgi:hypothetical protein
MAEDVAIRGSNYVGKNRSFLAVLGLTIITFGIYFFFYYYYLNKELAELGRARGTDALGTNPGNSILAVTLGALIIVPAFISYWNCWKRLEAARQMFGVQEGIDAVPGFLLSWLIGPVGLYFMVVGQNGVLTAQSQA